MTLLTINTLSQFLSAAFCLSLKIQLFLLRFGFYFTGLRYGARWKTDKNGSDGSSSMFMIALHILTRQYNLLI